MATAVVNGVRFDSEKPCQVQTVTWNGRTFTAGAMLLAALFAFQEWLDRAHPGLYVYVIQGAYNTDVAASAGTHDKDGCVDTLVLNRRTGKRVWVRAQWWWRTHHFYCWWRHAGSWLSPSKWHFHQIVVGIEAARCPVGEFVPGQISDAIAGNSGLVGHLRDATRRPARYTPFPYRKWVERKEEEAMGLSEEDWKRMEKLVADKVEAGWQKQQSNGLTRAGNVLATAVKAGVKKVVQG